MTELLIGALLGAVLSMFLQLFIIRAEHWWSSRKATMHGTWYEILPATDGLNRRVDEVKITQKGNRISGSAQRLTPKPETNRTWKFEGYATESRVIGFFYILNPQIDSASYTPIVLIPNPDKRQSAVWVGHYFRPALASSEEIEEGKMKPHKMTWQRKKP